MYIIDRYYKLLVIGAVIPLGNVTQLTLSYTAGLHIAQGKYIICRNMLLRRTYFSNKVRGTCYIRCT